MSKPSLPQGTRDFGSDVVRKRNYILDSIREIFEIYGFQPLETPAMENLDTLMGKYGEEGDKLIFRILNNGLDAPEKQKKALEEFEKVLQGKSTKVISERALKYDLTIPFARYVAMNHQQLTFPFKRYQMQPVWRADRPQRGRYREFYQCDADVVGSHSLINEIEFINIYNDVFQKLGIPESELRINHRKILTGLAELCGGPEKMTAISVAIDKLDKIGKEKVFDELRRKKFTDAQTGLIEDYLSVTGTNAEKLIALKSLLGKSKTGGEGISDLEYILSSGMISTQEPVIDFTLARGLNYYTGIIFEVKAPKQVSIGSIGGGGRYDDLTGLFDVPGIPGVGISFGIDRIYDVLEETGLFPETVHEGTRVLFFNLGENESKKSFDLMQQLRSKGIKSELFHEKLKFERQFKYAEKKKIPYVVIVGSQELADQTCTVKNLQQGVQQTIPQKELINFSF